MYVREQGRITCPTVLSYYAFWRYLLSSKFELKLFILLRAGRLRRGITVCYLEKPRCLMGFEIKN